MDSLHRVAEVVAVSKTNTRDSRWVTHLQDLAVSVADQAADVVVCLQRSRAKVDQWDSTQTLHIKLREAQPSQTPSLVLQT